MYCALENHNESEGYEYIRNLLLIEGNTIGNTKELSNVCIEILSPTTKEIYFPNRKISENYAKAELNWYWSGSNSMEEIAQHAKLWRKLSDDGITNNSAYGYIIHKKYGYDQLQKVIEILKFDPNSRRAVINISDPTLDKKETKDLQCTIALQFLIRNGSLEMTVYMRSNDIYFGFPYDYIYFVSLGEYVAYKLGIDFSVYTHHATSMHMYLKDVDKFIPHSQISNLNVDEIIRRNYDATYKI